MRAPENAMATAIVFDRSRRAATAVTENERRAPARSRSEVANDD